MEGARQVRTRDADAVTLLKDGKFYDLQDLRAWTSRPHPHCATPTATSSRAAAKIDRSKVTYYLSVAIDIERQLPNIKWLLVERCDLDSALATLEKNIKTESDSPRMDQLAATFGALRQPR